MMAGLVVLIGLTAGAGPARLGLADALAEAKARAPQVAEAASREAIANAGVAGARSLGPTTLSGDAGQDDPFWSVALTQRFAPFGSRSERVAAAKEDLAAARLEREEAGAVAAAAARRAYFALVLARGLAELAHRTAAIAARGEETARERFQSGAAPELDVVQAHLAVATALAEVDAREGEVGARSAELALVLGRDPAVELEPADAPDAALPGLDAVLAAAAKGPAARARDAGVAAAEARLSAADRSRLPAMGLGGGVERGNGGAGYAVRGTIELELADLGMNRGEVAQAAAELDAARTRRDLARRRRDAQVVAAHRRLASLIAVAAAYPSQILPAADRAEAMALDAYEAGRTPLVQLLEAQRAAADVRERALDAAYEAQGAFADLEEAAGVPLDAP